MIVIIKTGSEQRFVHTSGTAIAELPRLWNIKLQELDVAQLGCSCIINFCNQTAKKNKLFFSLLWTSTVG